MEKMKETEKAIKKIEELNQTEPEGQDKKIKYILLKNNLSIAIFNDVMPKFCEIWNKYEGKQYGEKTSEKIRREIEQAFDDCIFCFAYSKGIDISLRETQRKYSDSRFDRVAIITKNYNIKLLNNNKIQKINQSDFMIQSNAQYTENLDKAIKILKEKHARALDLQSELLNICKEFDSLTGYKINPIRYSYIVNNYLL